MITNLWNEQGDHACEVFFKIGLCINKTINICNISPLSCGGYTTLEISMNPSQNRLMFSSSALVIVSASCSVSTNPVEFTRQGSTRLWTRAICARYVLNYIEKKGNKKMYMFVHEFHMWSICYAKCLLFVVKFNWGIRFCLFVCFSSFSLFCSLTEIQFRFYSNFDACFAIHVSSPAYV